MRQPHCPQGAHVRYGSRIETCHNNFFSMKVFVLFRWQKTSPVFSKNTGNGSESGNFRSFSEVGLCFDNLGLFDSFFDSFHRFLWLVRFQILGRRAQFFDSFTKLCFASVLHLCKQVLYHRLLPQLYEALFCICVTLVQASVISQASATFPPTFRNSQHFLRFYQREGSIRDSSRELLEPQLYALLAAQLRL